MCCFTKLSTKSSSCWKYRGLGTGIEVYSKRLIYSKLPKILHFGMYSEKHHKSFTSQKFHCITLFPIIEMKGVFEVKFQ